MINPITIEKVVLGSTLTIEEVVAIARYDKKVEFSKEYIDRVLESRKLVEKFSNEERVVYGITTGLGDNCREFINKADREIIQINNLRSHATSLGAPLNRECVRAIMVAMIQQLGSGYTGIRLETVDKIRELLNKGVTPFAPRHGSVGYIGIEAHIALVIIGEGKAYYKGQLLSGAEALREARIEPTVISSKEGLSLVSGTSSVTGLTCLSIYDAMIIGKTNDISGSMSLEVLKGTLMAMDERLMAVRPHANQSSTAYNIRTILKDSEILEKYQGHRVQDALSLRCMPQLHGAAKKSIADGKVTIDIELNSSVDNPHLFKTSSDNGVAVMGCNADAAYVGITADTLCISIGNMVKMSERRIDRMVNRYVSDLPAFLNSNPGLNNGLMIPQYAAAGIVGEIRLLTHPATVDNVPTCAFQEDYVSMGYNAALKAYNCMELARYVIAIEIMTSVQAQDFYKDLKPATATKAVYDLVRKDVLFVNEDRNMHPDMECIAGLIKEGAIIAAVERVVGELKF
ncbi:HAL/PAL/TAL family ammonia-lyase [Alkaliphilus hydrothermalis]|uniref:Histidine ammonia-lyase n=1 Tax=Alkaliphilus hydrothermalis TaxID=1482730 RepID=A0ABS2NTJ4_9FIRM|nr:aromatic amino acid ammonia-lyase [Alkaliphilus hydrothermalis]MBM7616146.1 histidine ammonia-lyase [Alkaliphilus hydrothermalis]